MPPFDFKIRPWQGAFGACRPAHWDAPGVLTSLNRHLQGARRMQRTELPS